MRALIQLILINTELEEGNEQGEPPSSANPQEEQQKKEDVDIDESDIEMMIAGGNDVIAQCRVLA
ncbi:hypothetical protein GOP47_0016258 [Adiantum capillus-veneris]|uniref:Uncharacterized protein n=1 Tax=Adiantum capillus-veneris TaxID=13818 RepID=A0A9D4ZA44_ADICA|nr:hypothetical protein GOP47_0016258 [Adiantum capillus-veneris]